MIRLNSHRSLVSVVRAASVIGASALLLAGCFGSDSDDDDRGEVYVAVGNSLTSGFQSGGLRRDWQESSYPALIAEQMGITNFQLPLIDTPGIGATRIGGQPATPLEVDSAGVIQGRPLNRTAAQIQAMLLNSKLDRPYDNLGVPGATTSDFTNAFTSGTSQTGNNPYFDMVLRNGSLFQNQSMMRQAISRQPTILTMWLGSNDILGGILAGTVIEGFTVTPTAFYTALMDKALDTLLRETTAHIFLANIPAITTIPYVTTVPTYVWNPATQQGDTTTKLVTVEADVQFVLLSALGEIAQGNGIPTTHPTGTGAPLAANLTLTQAEVEIAARLTTEYNAYLAAKAAANSSRITLVDINSLQNDLTEGKVPGLTSGFIAFDPQSAFSLDGIHPNSKGYRQVANFFIDAINTTLKRNISKVP